MSTEILRPPDGALVAPLPDGLSDSEIVSEVLTLGALCVGARLILRCRKDWRVASVAAFDRETGRVVLSVASPSGHTYRVRRPLDSPLTLDGPLPVLGERSSCWRAGLARYDRRW